MYSLESYVSVVILIVLQRQNEIQLVLVLRKLLRAGKAVFKIPRSTGSWGLEYIGVEFDPLHVCDVLLFRKGRLLNWGREHIQMSAGPPPFLIALFFLSSAVDGGNHS